MKLLFASLVIVCLQTSDSFSASIANFDNDDDDLYSHVAPTLGYTQTAYRITYPKSYDTYNADLSSLMSPTDSIVMHEKPTDDPQWSTDSLYDLVHKLMNTRLSVMPMANGIHVGTVDTPRASPKLMSQRPVPPQQSMHQQQTSFLPTRQATKAQTTKTQPTKAQPTKTQSTKAQPKKTQTKKTPPTKTQPTKAQAMKAQPIKRNSVKSLLAKPLEITPAEMLQTSKSTWSDPNGTKYKGKKTKVTMPIRRSASI